MEQHDHDVVRMHLELGMAGVTAAGDPVGAGFLIDPAHIVTCAHTVNEALGRHRHTPEWPLGSVTLTFPFADRSVAVRARVVKWRPVGGGQDDVAVLRLEDAQPSLARPVRLVGSHDIAGHPFLVWGYPLANAGEMFATGAIQRRRGDDRIQVVAASAVGQSVRAGFSGAAVWDEALEGVIGMVVAADPDPLSRTAYVLPSDVIAQVFPGVKLANVQKPGATRRVVGERVSAGVDVFRDRVLFRARLRELLLNRDYRVISISGRRGIGKSGLVARVLADFEDAQDPDAAAVGGIAYLSTRTGAGVVDVPRVFHSLTQLLDAEQRDRLEAIWGNTADEAVTDLLMSAQGRRLVLVLDNLDDLQDPDTGELLSPGVASFIASTCRMPHSVLIVATSQRPLRLSSELRHHMWTIEVAEGLDVEEAVELLRRLDASGEADLRDLEEEQLRRLVEGVHRTPRGLELLVSLLADSMTMTVQRVLASQSTPEGLLRELVTEGFASLDDIGRDVVRLLALADTPMPTDAFPKLLEDRYPADATREVVDRLINRRMLSFDRVTGRARLHPIDSDYVRSSLDRDPENRSQLDLQLADWLGSMRTAPETWRSSADIGPQRREARHRLRAGDVEGALRAIAEMAEFLVRHGEAQYVRRWLDEASGQEHSDATGYSHLARGLVEFFVGSLAEAINEFQAARDAAVSVRETELTARANMWLGHTMRHAGRAAEAIAPFRSAAALDVTDHALRAIVMEALLGLALTHCYLGRLDDAEAIVDRFRAVLRPTDPAVLQGGLADVLSVIFLKKGNYVRALEEIVKGLRIYGDSPKADIAGYLINVRGLVYLAQNEYDAAEQDFMQTVDDAAALQQARLEGFGALNLAWTRLILGDHEGALTSAQRAAAQLNSNRVVEALSAEALVAALESGDAAAAYAHLERAITGSLGNPDLYQPQESHLLKLAAAAAHTEG